MYMKGKEQIEFRKRFGLYYGFDRIRFRRGKPIFPKNVDSVKEGPRITRDVIKK